MPKIEYSSGELTALAEQLKPYLGLAGNGVPPPEVPPPAPPVTPPPPAPPPVSPGPVISARWDSAPSQWAKWNFITATETTKLENIYGINPVATRINWYQATHRLDGKMNPDGTYDFVNGYAWWGAPQWVRDENGAADAKHKADLVSIPEIDPLA